MKIAINGTVIDTKDIYKITPVRFCGDYFTFNVYQFNVKYPIEVNKYYERNWSISNEELEKTLKYRINFNKINKFRDDIIFIWSRNQSKIPQFNIE